MIHYHYELQGSPEWLELRKEKLTASHATPIGADGAGLKTYCNLIVSEKVGSLKEQFTNTDMERGNELEPIAIMTYEIEKGVDVDIVGFITNDDFPGVGASPDGLIGDNGGLEVKARNNEKHLALIRGEEKEIPHHQIQMTLLISGREWWDFVSFNENFAKSLFVKRIFPDLEYHEKLKKGFESGRKLIKEFTNQYEQYNF